ncbi:efflux RND transporter periplasmic adaptor subunit [Breoghania sp. L-A4]|uniref:efflux RND transporter periplasmic adaptor subunit n=1 Tax=Breoghania sp. L-A4 TaxID=2304600 RepID=UPI0013C2A468|nr:efflux RND transporter periplasmic adaptor subunit [Breoghania sp. L-A4]
MPLVRWPAIGTVALAVALAGGVTYLSRTQQTVNEAEASPTASGTEKTRPGVAVETAEVGVGTIVEDIRAFGTLVANESVIVAPEIAGRVAKIHFTEAQSVKTGDVLIELDAEILKAQLDKSRSDVELAKSNFERADKLAAQGSGTLRARDETAASYRAANVDLALAEAHLAKTRITAPFAGVVGFRAISAGAYVTPGQRIVELASIDPLKVEFQVSETYLPALVIGLPVHVTVDARPGEQITGKITAIDPIVDVGGRAIRLRAQVPNPDGRLSPGLFARIRVIVDQRPGAMVVPEAAVFQDGGQLYVYRIRSGKTEKTAVSIGQRQPGTVEIRDGLLSDDIVVTAGQLLLRDGASVKVVDGPGGA